MTRWNPVIGTLRDGLAGLLSRRRAPEWRPAVVATSLLIGVGAAFNEHARGDRVLQAKEEKRLGREPVAT